jgi:glycosyltransferase involved in cell wall biosynthesis
MLKLSVIIITFNEENNIKECLESAMWADELLIVDSGSTDKTIEIAKGFTDKILISYDKSYSSKRNFAIDKAQGEWIMWLDADERITEKLKNEIKELINSPSPEYRAYLIKRKSFFINKFINHCGWYPDFGLRLFKKSEGIKFNDSRVHEKPLYSGKTAKLRNEILHFTDLTFEHYVQKLNSYTAKSALDMHEKGKTASLIDIVFRPVFTFLKMYFLKLGILDGYMGLVLCTLSGFHVFIKYSKMYFLTKNS